jgi:hypothetical protein
MKEKGGIGMGVVSNRGDGEYDDLTIAFGFWMWVWISSLSGWVSIYPVCGFLVELDFGS